MFKIEDTTIHMTRGNDAVIGVIAENHDDTLYTFEPGDKLRFAVYEKGNYGNMLLEKFTNIDEETQEAKIALSKNDTKIGEIINKPVNCWYEIELHKNGKVQTIMGHDDEGAKIFRLYPEGVDE